MRPIGPVDQLFLWLEQRQQPMHVAGLQLFSFPEDAGPKYIRDLAEAMREYHSPKAPFNQRIVSRFGQFYATEDKQFDIEHHFRHQALPKPGRIRELLALVSAEHSSLLDRQRPLWEVHLIEGVRNRRFALYTKVHHSMVDGVAAMRMGIKALSYDPSERELPPVWAHPMLDRSTPNSYSANPVKAMGKLARFGANVSKQLATVPTLARTVYDMTQKAKTDPDYVSVFQAPETILNQKITGSRRFAAQSYTTERFRQISRAFGCTLNDVVLTVCSSALRDYLISQNALPDKPLIAMVPVNLRSEDDTSSGNQIAMVLANLATHIADPANRLRTIKASMDEAKERYRQMTPAEILNLTGLMMAPMGLHLLTGLAPEWRAFNVVISNVPGPSKPLYWNGAKLEGMYPVSIALNQIALNITLTSYCDQLEFGIIGCRRTLPSMQRLLDYFENGLKDLEVSAGLR